jgi:hypothetical protein
MANSDMIRKIMAIRVSHYTEICDVEFEWE